jgi:hypothetical protein
MCYKCTENMTECVRYSNPDKCKGYYDMDCQHCEWFQCEDNTESGEIKDVE